MIRETLEMLQQYGQTVTVFYREPAAWGDNNESSNGELISLPQHQWRVGYMEFSEDCVREVTIYQGGLCAHIELLGFESVMDDPLALGPCNDCGLNAATKMTDDLLVCDRCHQEWCESFEPGDAHYHPRS